MHNVTTGFQLSLVFNQTEAFRVPKDRNKQNRCKISNVVIERLSRIVCTRELRLEGGCAIGHHRGGGNVSLRVQRHLHRRPTYRPDVRVQAL
eukprot:1177203-Prorocentrum_minimum.AAC.3